MKTIKMKIRKDTSQFLGRRQSTLPRRMGIQVCENPYDGPYKIVQVNTNGTVCLKKGAVTDTVNIRLLKPYKL